MSKSWSLQTNGQLFNKVHNPIIPNKNKMKNSPNVKMKNVGLEVFAVAKKRVTLKLNYKGCDL